MSGYPGGSGEGGNNNGLDSLFAQLRQQQPKPVNLEPSYSYYNNNNAQAFYGQQQPSSQQSHLAGYHQPSVSSPLPTPPAHNQHPHHSSGIMSPVESVQPRIALATGGTANADRTSSLLNLLKFSQPSSGSPHQPAPIGTPLPPSRQPSMAFGGPDVQGQVSASAPGRGGSDLLAALMGSHPRSTQEIATALDAEPPQATFTNSASSPPADTQAYLLQLLNQPKPAQSDVTPHIKPAKVLTPPSKASTPDDVEELAQALEDASLDINLMGASATEGTSALAKENDKPAAQGAQGLFTYVNPFEQLAASSPRHRTPKAATPGPAASSASAPMIQILKHPRHESSPDNKRKMDERSTISSPAHTKRRLESASQQSSAPPTPLPDGRTPLEALIGIGAVGTGAHNGKETVHNALSEVGDRVDKQVQEAIARAERDESQASIEQDLRDLLTAKSETEFKVQAEHTAQAIKEELEKEENSGALDGLPAPVAEAVKGIIDDTAQGHIADSWESADAEAEDSPSKTEVEHIVKVYNFPMKPWISIHIKSSDEPRPVFREEAVMDIARLKKEFDQVDRTLVTASGTFIVYGMSKNGGVRIIRQEDGKDARVFTETQDRIFSVGTSCSQSDLKEAVIATGVSGTVYWVLIKDGEGDHLDDSMPEMYGFALPPVQAQDNETPGGVLKTRARKSSNHPEYFGVGRGKFIHIIFPSVILKRSYLRNGKGRIVDTDKYLGHLSLKINAGKAGKDFTFSEDDSTIVSLDKAGKVKFWDIRSLTKNGGTNSEHIEIKEPLMTFTTTPANEKSWPTSVLFVDKLRPYQKGGALRYMIVGMKQNHTLQLWDLALQKPVQEIHLPHTKESDAVCSVLYHAATGMIIVGHPTRNSIYFLHLSAPKYNLSKSITQAEYMEKLLSNDPTVLKPDSTAVISGMREYSFADKGLLRSVDLLSNTNVNLVEGEAPIMFELYCMHSKGVTCLIIKQADLGWTLDNKVIHAVQSPEKSGIISIDTLNELPTAPASEAGEAVATTVPSHNIPRPSAKEFTPRETPKKPAAAETPASTAKVDEKKEAVVSNAGLPASAGSTEKAEKKKRRKANSSSENAAGTTSTSQPTQPKAIVLDPSSHVRNGNVSKANNSNRSVAQAQDVSDATLKGIEVRVAGEVKKSFAESLDSLYKNITDDRRTQSAVADAKQDAMLRLVSSTLSDNIELTLGRIVGASIQKSVLPVITDVASKAVSEQLGAKLNEHVAQTTPRELQNILPDLLSKALQQPQLLKLMADALAQSVAFQVEEQFSNLLQGVVVPAFTNLAIQTTQKVSRDVQQQAAEQIGLIEQQRHTDNVKIEQLTQLVTGLTETVSSMAAAQAEFQGQFLRLQKQAAGDRRHVSLQTEESSASVEIRSKNAPSEKSPEEVEYMEMLASIQEAMSEGNYENAVIQWLQTRREQEFFARFFSQYNPTFVQNLSPLLLLSLGATISIQLEDQYLIQRITWMETILAAFQGRLNAGELVSSTTKVNILCGTYTNQ
jgi:WD40 repeat protein